MATRYWVVSLPVQNSASTLWNQLQDRISKHSFDTPLYRFNIPNLRVGTLDSLLSLSDDLVKSNNFMEGVSQKIRRQIEELERASGVMSSGLTVDGVPVDSYLTRFVWDEAKYPTMSPLKEIVDGIHGQVAKIEDDLKVRVSEFNNIRSQLNAINRKQSGSLAVRDLSNLVKPEDIVTSEHLTTLLAIVPKYSQKDWLSSYETLTSYVVPRSSKKLYEDNDYALYTVTLFSRVADNFRTSAREKGFQIRDFEHSPESHESLKQELEKLMQDQESLRGSLLQWCYASYGEVFSSWMHFCAVRLFTESILRYGLPPSFLACVLAPSVKAEKKVRSILEGLSDTANMGIEKFSTKMRMSCNGCRVLRKGCSENCSIRPCLQWIKSPESQANATVFLAKFYGRAGLMNLVNAGPEHLRPAIFRSLLYEACGRIVNPIYGSVGLLWSGSWQLCQAAVEAVLKGAPITPITSEAAASGRGPPFNKAYDIRHVSKDENSAASNETQTQTQQRVKTRSRVKRSLATKAKPTIEENSDKRTEPGSDEPNVACDAGRAWIGCCATEEVLNRSASHESSLSHQSEAAEGESKESESMVSVETAETSILFRDEPESNRVRGDRTGESCGDHVGLELTLGFEPASREHHVVPVKKRRIEFKNYCGGSAENSSCKMELGLEYQAA